MFALVNGLLDDVEITKVQAFESALESYMKSNQPNLMKEIADKKEISPETEEKLKKAIEECKKTVPY